MKRDVNFHCLQLLGLIGRTMSMIGTIGTMETHGDDDQQ